MTVDRSIDPSTRARATVRLLHRLETLRRVWFTPDQLATLMFVAASLPQGSVGAFFGGVAVWCARYMDVGQDGTSDSILDNAVAVALHDLGVAA
jgi:hypothetical protein